MKPYRPIAKDLAVHIPVQLLCLGFAFSHKKLYVQKYLLASEIMIVCILHFHYIQIAITYYHHPL